MESSIAQDPLDRLIPVLSAQDKEGILAYLGVSQKYAQELSEKGKEIFKDHPVFGSLLRDIPPEVAEYRDKLSRQLQKDAVLHGHWRPYIDDLIQQGVFYAKLGLDFGAWYELIGIGRKFLTPYLHLEYGTGEVFLNVLNGMNTFLDITMSILGEAYVQEKRDIIKQANDRLSSIFEAAADMIFVLEVEENERYRFSAVNDAYVAVTGVSMEQVVGKYVDEIATEEALQRVMVKYRQAIQEKRIVRWDQTMRFPAKEVIGEVSIVPLFDTGGNCLRLVGAVHDMSERINAENELKKLNEVLEQKVVERTAQLEAANKELESFTYSVSHDLRAPLRGVNGYAQMLVEDYGPELDDEGKRIIDAISSSAAKMGRLIDELLAFSQLGRKEIKRTTIDMNVLTAGVISEIAKLVKHDAKIKVGPLHPVEADYGLLHQVMFNLISNAIKYSSKKENPVIEIASEQHNEEVIFSIQDNGSGFDMRYISKLFGVFQRLHSQEEFEGSGVGLAIVQRIITRHGGRVWAESKVDEGATFYFSFNN